MNFICIRKSHGMQTSQCGYTFSKMRTFLVSAVLCLILGIHFGNCARILGIFPTPSISHQVVFRGLTLALNKRGHELVVLTPNTVNDTTLTNYTEIDLSDLYSNMQRVNFIEIRKDLPMVKFLRLGLGEFGQLLDTIFQRPEFEKIYSRQSNEKFDLLILEMLYGHAFYGLAARFDVPIIGITSLGLTMASHYAVGNPFLTSHPSIWEIGKNAGYQLSFWQRLDNFIESWRLLHYFETQFIPQQHELAKKYLGDDIPYVGDIEKNISLVFTNQQALLSHVRPKVPKVIEIGGFHVSKEVQSLPKDLQTFLDDAAGGFVYMSLGTNVKSQMLSNSTKADIMAVFSKLPQKVLWKFEDDLMPGKPKNVYISKWFPQQAVLAHRNIKAFIYQGGLQSTEEAVDHAVPLIGIPVMADQDTQVDKMVALGVAKKLEIVDFNSNDFETTLHDVINNKSYKGKMLELRSLINDRPYDPLQNAVWWTEFVIRHKGAPHLHCSIADEKWYQRYDVDILAFISISAFTVFVILLIIAYRIMTYSLRLLNTFRTDIKQKKS